MNRTLTIEGMMCAHCAAHVESALNALPGVSTHVDLRKRPPPLQRVRRSRTICCARL